MLKLQKDTDIRSLEKELYVAHKRGYVFRYIHLTELNALYDYSKIVGIEILFSDTVTDDQISGIKNYIEKRYGMIVDTTTYMNPNETPKIVIVRY